MFNVILQDIINWFKSLIANFSAKNAFDYIYSNFIAKLTNWVHTQKWFIIFH